MSEDQKNYTVGYKKPPRATRFKKGQSGNPKGRPQKGRALKAPLSAHGLVDDILREEVNRTIKVTDANGTAELKALQVAVRAQMQSAMKGNALAQRDVVKAAFELEQCDAQRAATQEEQRRASYAWAIDWRARRIKEWHVAAEQGREPGNPWPHPDDIILDSASGNWWIRGPSSGEHLPRFEYYEALRDEATLKSGMVQRTCGHSAMEGMLSLYLCCWEFYDHLLPLRWQNRQHAGRISLGLEITDLRKLRKLREAASEDVASWHRIVYPRGEEVRLDDDLACAARPHLKKLGFSTIRAFERYLEQQSGNPPLR